MVVLGVLEVLVVVVVVLRLGRRILADFRPAGARAVVLA